MSQGKELNAMLLMEGRTVPFIGATCTFKAGQPSTATINMVPLREINNVLPRTMVHLFVKDYTYPWSGKPWILAFEGEVYGYGLGKNPQSRSFDMYCMGISNYWDNAKQYYMNTMTAAGNMNSQMSAQKMKVGVKKDQVDIIETPAGLKAYLVNLITSKLKGPKGSDAFLEAILEILKGVEKVNPFFKYNNQRYRLTDRIGFCSSGQISKIFDFTRSELFLQALTGKGNGGLMTIRQVINMLMGLIFHNFVSVPFPSKIPSDIKDGIGPKKNKTIGSFLFKPDSFMLPPPKCNVLYPDQYNNLTYSRNFFHEVSRTQFTPTPVFGGAAAKVYEETLYAPSAFSEFQKGPITDVSGGQLDNAGASGQVGEKYETPMSNILREFNFLSYEEVLKGIFSEQGHMMPSAQLLVRGTEKEKRNEFFQNATNYMFYKKRFASRNSSTSGPLNFAPVPGFPIVLLDDSDAEQNIVGKLESLMHSFSANGGGYTSYEVTYSRLVEEQDFWNGDLSEPPIPPWYDKEVFGERRKVNSQDYKNLPVSMKDRIESLGSVNDFGNSSIKDYYAKLLGNSQEGTTKYLGSSPITSKA